jgi:myo-inositol-1(or 4)-monophosphatase
MSPTLVDLEKLARQAGEIVRSGFGGHNRIYHKGEIDLVTDVDRRAEDFLIQEIQARFPEGRIVTEESGLIAGGDCCTWYVDPLDGTVNFAHGVPVFSVSIAYAEANALRLGIVYDPLRDECFGAELGKGAWLNGKSIVASQADDLGQSLLVTGFPYDIRTNPRNNLDLFARFSMLTQGVRRFGSAALDLCYVAAGRFDGFWELSLSPWDLAAGALIASQAGAAVTDLSGGANYLLPPCAILASAPRIHSQMMKIIQEGLPNP